MLNVFRQKLSLRVFAIAASLMLLASPFVVQSTFAADTEGADSPVTGSLIN